MKPPFVSQFVFSLPKKVKRTQKEEGVEKKDETGDTVNRSCTNAPIAQVTGSHWASSGPCSAMAPPGHHGLIDAQRRSQVATQQCGPSREGGTPISSLCHFCLCLAASWLATSQPLSFAPCKSWQQKRVVLK